jgi:hypothetical protein
MLLPAAASESANGVRDSAAVASERIVTLLIGSDDKNLAAHRDRLHLPWKYKQRSAGVGV